ncbi:Regulatory protein [Yarrowia sp. B02]|nr:Regulatory protein [Yarrowia sp. B02]
MTDRLFLANLNAIEDPQHTEPSPDNDDLSIFTNTQFFDFDMGCSTDIAASVDDMIVEQEKYLQKIQQQQAHQQQQQQHQPQAFQPQPPSSSRSQYDSLKNPGGENLHMDFDFNEFSILEQQQQQPQPQPQPQPQRPILQPVSQKPANYQPVSPQSTMTSTGVGTASMPPPTAGPTQEEIQAAILANSQQVKKRKQSSVDVSVASTPAKSPESYDGDCSIKAAEDDKRRRNTAASARFRIKKKMREQEMEKQAKDLQDKVSSLEAKILSLEMENKWLKNLVVEKNDARGADELQNLKDSVLRETTPVAKIEQI